MWKYSQTGQFKLVPRCVVTRSFVTMSPCLILATCNLPADRKVNFRAVTFRGVNGFHCGKNNLPPRNLFECPSELPSLLSSPRPPDRFR